MHKITSQSITIVLLSIILVFNLSSFSQTTSQYTSDDYGEENASSGSMYLTSSDLELCYDGHQQVVGLHFSSVAINQGSTINSAYIQFTADESQSGTGFTITIKGHDVDNSSTFSSTDYDVSSRTRTTASVTWNPSAWTQGDNGADQQSPDIANIIQELVDRAGWANGNDITIIIEANTGSSSNHRTSETNPVLIINSNTPAPAREDLMYYVPDADDNLYIVNRTNGNCSLIGSNGSATNIETIANWPAHLGNQLYATDGGTLVTLNTSDGSPTTIGEVDGGSTANGSIGAQTLNDIDGLAFDARTGKLWGSNRRSGSNEYDLLFQINPTTGHFVEDAFGSGVDYIVIDGNGVNYDIDDIAISPVTGEMFVVNNNGGTNDQILKINKSTGAVEVTTSFQSLSDVEGSDFANDGTFYVTSGNGNSFSSANTSDGSSTYIKNPLDGGGDVESLASLVAETNTMEGTVWKDADADGIKDANETTYISNVEIDIYYDANGDGVINGSDEYLNTVKTDANGDWYFDYATTGHLIAKINESTLPSGYALTSDATQTANFTSSGTYDSNNDFGALDGADCDGDGIPNFKEGTADTDGDGVQDQCDKDSDNDGITDLVEGTRDTDGDGIPDYLDLDSDNDGIPDAIEANGGAASANYNSSTGRIGGSDSDGDGIMNSVDAGSTSNLVNYDTDGDGVRDYRDLDSDNDGILDIVEAGGADENGDGTVDTFNDSNSDGYNDSYASSPLPIYNNDAATEAVFLPNYRDIDSDGDSIDDSREGYSPADYKTPSIIKDSDGDGILDIYDVSEGGASIVPFDYDNDGVPDYQDQDSDNDSGSDMVEGNDANGDGEADSSPSGNDANKNGLDDAFDKSCTGASNINITAGSKNEETVSDGSAYLTSSDIEMVYDGHQQIVGIRFNGVNVAQGASVTTANIQFTTDNDGSNSTGAITLTIHGEKSVDAADVSNNNYDISGRTQTSASVTWSPSAWDTPSETGENQKTPNLGSIITEIVGQAGWQSGNSVMIIIEGTSTTEYRRSDWANSRPVLSIVNEDGLKYNCGSDIAVNDNDSNGKKDFRDVGTTLPVALISFTAEKVGNNAQLNWTTASEENNDYFIVEKSTDNVNFEEIDRVKGAGNSNVILKYQSIDYNLSEGTTYYRLRQVDFDSKYSISNVVAIRNNPDNEVSIFPNPSNGDMSVETNEDIDLIIYSISGQELASYHFEANTINKIDITNQPKGIYFLAYETNNKRVIKKLIVR